MAEAAVRLLSMHLTSCSAERNWSAWGLAYQKARASMAIERAEKLIYIKTNIDADDDGYKQSDEEALLAALEEAE